MPIAGKSITHITEADLRTLILNREAEGKTIDYKRDRVGASDAERKEFLYDISSFANTAGGYIVVGMDESGGIPVALPGLADIDPDSEIARLEQIARDGLRPPIIGLRSAAVRLANGNIALVLYIPKSWNPPHQVTYQKAFRFYGRGTNAKYQIDVDELRSIFALSEGAANRIRLFQIDRIAKIAAGDGLLMQRPRPMLVIHAMPLSAFTTTNVMDLEPLWRDPTLLIRINGRGQAARFNIDGLLLQSSHDEPAPSYTQVYRNGCIEAVYCVPPEAVERSMLPSTWFEQTVIYAIQNVMKVLQTAGILPPMVVLAALLGIKDWHIGVPPDRSSGAGGSFGRDPLVIPDIVIDAFDGDAARKARPLIDMFWNAAGWPASPNYDQTGRWKD